MKRRAKVSRKAGKAGRRKAAMPRRSVPPKTAPGGRSAAAFIRERDEALAREKATAAVLRVIRASPGELKPVFDAILANAVRICEAKFAAVYRFDGKAFSFEAEVNTSSEFAEFQKQRGPFQPTAGGLFERVLRTKLVARISDLTSEAASTAGAKFGGARSSLGVPMLKDDVLVGAIFIYRQEVRPFSDKQIELVENFAAQAVIAIENARLLNELRETLAQQTATSEVLSVISSRPGELEPVFQTILESAIRICEANFGLLHLHDNATLRMGAMHNVPAPFGEAIAQRGPSYRPGPLTPNGRLVATKQVVQLLDYADSPAYRQRDAAAVRLVELAGARTVVGVPMLKDDELIGTITIFRQEVRPFTDKQIALVRNFAAQAVIAIENARLLNELRQRTDDLTKSLEQQTATADVLKVISSSPGELAPVFNSVLENAVRICAASFGVLMVREGDVFRRVALANAPQDYQDFAATTPLLHRSKHPSLDHIIETRAAHQIADMSAAEPEAPVVRFGHARSLMNVPMVREGELVGVIGIYRREVRPFTDKQIALVQNFAAQAVIAIENARLLNELRESLQQQTATSEVLSVISSSPGRLEPVFQSVLDNAVRICEAKFGFMNRYEGDTWKIIAVHGAVPAYTESLQQHGYKRPGSETVVARIATTKQLVHIDDLAASRGYIERDPVVVAAVELGGVRTMLGVPMLKEDKLIGAILLYRQEVRPFTDKQIALVQNFAAQAVIAIENARLLNELRQRTDDLTESLEQQTATSEVLQVISSSTGDLKPVFDAMLANAVKICGAGFGNLSLYDGKDLRMAAMYNPPPAYLEARGSDPVIPLRNAIVGPVVTSKRVNHVPDLATEEPYAHSLLAQKAGARTALGVPMLREGALVGAIAIYRQEVRPFTDKQIELVQNFAAQAVIAIENTRLLNELRESLEQQTATSEVLSVISSSPGQLQPVFQAMLANAVRICEAKFGSLFRFDGDEIQFAAEVGTPAEYAEFQKSRRSVRPRPGTLLDRAARTKQVIHTADYAAEPFPGNAATLGGARSTLCVPMLKDDTLVGVIFIYRQEVRPFTDKQIDLVRNFAAQAVIAIENTRLLNELRQRTEDLTESLEQQTATSEVLRVISASPGELEPVFKAMLENAAHICDAKFGVLLLSEGDAYRVAAIDGEPPAAYVEERRRNPIIRPRPETALGRAVSTRSAVQVADIQVEADDGSAASGSTGAQLARLAGARTVVSVPMVRDDELVGAILIFRQEVRPFTDKQIDLVQNFAAQAVIAIENTRLLNELRQRTDDLSKSLEDLRTAQDRLVQTQKLASLGQLTAGIAHEIKNPLNFVNNFSGVSVELIDELQEALRDASLTEKARADINELSDTLRDNLGKIVQHGKRADSIVKNMLLHSREGAGERRPVDINALVEESLNLAYHGARAEKQGFNVALERSFDPAAGEVEAFPQEISRVLLNLIANSFYAAAKRQAQEGANGFEPTIKAATKSLGDRVEIRIRDNGIGIPPGVRDKMFNPFFTTKPAGEGTGLGLSISHDIIVKQHSGSIEVDTEPGKFTEFTIVLPRAAK